MSQSSVAVSVDGEKWLILNASPDIRDQLARTPQLQPRDLRGTPIEAVLLTNADVDHIAGLLILREKTGFQVLASGDILETLEANAIFNVLDRALVHREQMALDQSIAPLPGLKVTPLAVPGKVALFLEGDTVNTEEIGEQTIGLVLDDGTHRAAYVPGCASLPDWVVDSLSDVDLLLFDGTVWENDDMKRTGTGVKTGKRMGHVQMAGPNGSLARLAGVDARKIFVHINNTNPVLQPAGPERKVLHAAGWEVAFDGMEIVL